jgi:hypothetical protein
LFESIPWLSASSIVAGNIPRKSFPKSTNGSKDIMGVSLPQGGCFVRGSLSFLLSLSSPLLDLNDSCPGCPELPVSMMLCCPGNNRVDRLEMVVSAMFAATIITAVFVY